MVCEVHGDVLIHSTGESVLSLTRLDQREALTPQHELHTCKMSQKEAKRPWKPDFHSSLSLVSFRGRAAGLEYALWV